MTTIQIKNEDDLLLNSKYISEFKKIYESEFDEKSVEPFQSFMDRIRYKELPITSMKLIIDDGGVIAGMISCFYPKCKCIKLSFLSVKPAHRGMGIGKMLLNGLWEEYGDIGCKHIFIEYDSDVEDSDEGLEMWKRRGFELVKGLHYRQHTPLVLLHNGRNDKRLSGRKLKKFLTESYRYKGYDDRNEELKTMLEEI